MAWSEGARVVDVSHWNPEEEGRFHHRLMDWTRAAGAGLIGVIVKYSQGSDGVDPAAFLHAANALKAGVQLLGGYHFGDGSDPERQAAHFLALMREDYHGDLSGRLLMLDAERNKAQISVSQAEIFVSAIHDSIGRWPWLYMGRYGTDGISTGLPSAVLANCPLLLPAYGNHEGNLGAILPKGWRLPKDAADRGAPGPNGTRTGVLRGWQFTDGTLNGGPFPGLGRVDQSRLIGVVSLAEAMAVWAS